MNKDALIKQVSEMRKRLKPVLSNKYNQLLIEVENELSSNGPSIDDVVVREPRKPTYKELVAKYYFE